MASSRCRTRLRTRNIVLTWRAWSLSKRCLPLSSALVTVLPPERDRFVRAKQPFRRNLHELDHPLVLTNELSHARPACPQPVPRQECQRTRTARPARKRTDAQIALSVYGHAKVIHGGPRLTFDTQCARQPRGDADLCPPSLPPRMRRPPSNHRVLVLVDDPGC